MRPCHTDLRRRAAQGPVPRRHRHPLRRAELCESILKPSAKIAQGFETQWFKTKDDDDYEGFVTREAGDEIEIRNVVGVVSIIKKTDIKERGKREIEHHARGPGGEADAGGTGVVLAYLESLKGQ